MTRWEYQPAFQSSGEGPPLYLRLAGRVRSDIQSGKLKPGDALPSSRVLAERLNISRNTVVAAYQELVSEGFLVARPAGLTQVVEAPPGLEAEFKSPHRSGPTPAFQMGASKLQSPVPMGAEGLARPGVIPAASGTPDPRLTPVDAFSRAYRTALRRAAKDRLSAPDPAGSRQLREELGNMLGSLRSLSPNPERLLLLRNPTVAMYLVAKALIQPGDAVAVESPGNPDAWRAFEQAGAKVVALPVDRDGLQVAGLEALSAQHPIRLIYVSPQRQYPTTVPLHPARRTWLLRWAATHKVAILESDAEAEFQFEGAMRTPLISEDTDGVCILVGSLSKLLASGFHLAYLYGHPAFLAQVKDLRAALDPGGDPILESAVTDLIRDGELQRHLHRMITVYRQRRDHLVNGLRLNLSDRVRVDVPDGGLALWLEPDASVDIEAWLTRALEAGVAFLPSTRVSWPGIDGRRGLRVGFSGHEPFQLDEIAQRLGQSLMDQD